MILNETEDLAGAGVGEKASLVWEKKGIVRVFWGLG